MLGLLIDRDTSSQLLTYSDTQKEDAVIPLSVG